MRKHNKIQDTRHSFTPKPKKKKKTQNNCSLIRSQIPLVSHTILSLIWITYAKERKRRPTREHECGAGQVPSESQVKSFHTTPEC